MNTTKNSLGADWVNGNTLKLITSFALETVRPASFCFQYYKRIVAL